MTMEELDFEIDKVHGYLNMLLHKRSLMEKIKAGRRVSAEIQTEKLIERLRCERNQK